MKLRTGRPLWLDFSGNEPPNERLGADISCDVLVIGSGVTGAMVALHLVEAGLDVVVVDKRAAASGSTPASTALIQYDIDVPLVELHNLIGRSKAERAYKATRKAIEDIKLLVLKHELDCAFSLRPGLYLASLKSDVELLKKESEARARLGIEASYLDNKALSKIFNISRPGAIYSKIEYELNPCLLTYQLLARALNLGARLFTKTEVQLEKEKSQSIKVSTRAGHKIKCGDIVIASGYETPEIFPALRKLCSLHSTYAIATQPVEPSSLWNERALIWEHAAPYLYARCTPDNRIIAGGEDEEFADPDSRDKLIPAKSNLILEKLRQLFPETELKIGYQWAGTFAETDDGLPIIGIPDTKTRCHFALGYGGNGITYSLLAAQIIRDRIQGVPNEVASLFSFERIKM